MSQPKSITARVGSAGLQVEYVKTRRVLRFRAASPALAPSGVASAPPAVLGRSVGRDDEVELTVSEFRDRLGIEERDLAPPVVYLLFGGRRLMPAGGTGDLLGSWESETEARAAFRRCREDQTWLWAELATLAGGTCQQVSWFGMERDQAGGDLRALDADAGPAPRRFRRLLRTSRTSA